MFKERLLQEVVEKKQSQHMKVRRRVLKLARELGVPLDVKREMDIWLRQSEPRWNGKTLIANPTVDNSDLLHDIAHWMVASKTARKHNEFGLGTAFRGPYVMAHYEPDTCTRMECMASLLGIALEVQCGRDPGETLEEHSWFDEDADSDQKFKVFIKKLREEFPRFKIQLKTVLDRINSTLSKRSKKSA